MAARSKTPRTVLYTVVDDGYAVEPFRSLSSVCETMAGRSLSLTEDGETPATVQALRKAVRADDIVRLYPLDGGDWVYRIEKHSTLK